MARSDYQSAPDRPAGGCTDYRLGLVLSALQKKLAEATDPAEKQAIRAEIKALEEKMGF